MGQSGADDEHGRVLLADLVHGAADRGELGGGDVLHLVDEESEAHPEVAAELADVGEQLDQVELEVAGVGTPLRRGYVGGGRPAESLAVLELGAQRERLEHARDGVDPVGVAVAVRDLADRGVDGLGDRDPQRLVGSRLDLAGPPRPADGLTAQGVEQHRLADTAQAADDHAALGTAGGDAFERDVEGGELAVTTGQLGRALTGARRVGVPDRVHAQETIGLSSPEP